MGVGQDNQVLPRAVVCHDQRNQIGLLIDDELILVGLVRRECESLIPSRCGEDGHALGVAGRGRFERSSDGLQKRLEGLQHFGLTVKTPPDFGGLGLEMRLPVASKPSAIEVSA